LDLTAGGDESDEARVQAALSSYIRSRRRGKRHAGPTDDDALSGGVSSGLSGGGGSGSGASGGNGGPPQLKSPKRSKSGTPEDGNTPGRRSPIDGSGGSGGGDSGGPGSAAHMQRFAQDVLASFAAMGSGGAAPGGAAGGASGHAGGAGGSLPPPLRYDLGGLFSDGPDGPFALSGDDVAADFLLDDLVGDPGGYNVLR
jgi:hypothetical protein